MINEILLSLGMTIGSQDIDTIENYTKPQLEDKVEFLNLNEMSEAEEDSFYIFFKNIILAGEELEENNLKGSEKLYQKAINLHENLNLPEIMLEEVYRNLSYIYSTQDIKNKSLEYGLRAHNIEPNNPLNKNNLAYALAKNDTLLTKALKLSKEAVEEMPNSSEVLETLGLVNFKLGQYNESIENIQKVIEMNSLKNNGENYHLLGKLYQKNGDNKKSEIYFQKAEESGFILNE